MWSCIFYVLVSAALGRLLGFAGAFWHLYGVMMESDTGARLWVFISRLSKSVACIAPLGVGKAYLKFARVNMRPRHTVAHISTINII